MSNQIDKRAIYAKFAQVSVNGLVMTHTSKCDHCNTNLQEFSVFVGEGQRLSTLYKSCCSSCLPSVIKDAIDEGRKDAENAVKSAEQRLYELPLH